MKPLKFEASIALYLATLAWLWGYLRGGATNPLARIFVAVSVGLLGFEIAYIVLQSARGVGSHFNTATPVEGLMFTPDGRRGADLHRLPGRARRRDRAAARRRVSRRRSGWRWCSGSS